MVAPPKRQGSRTRLRVLIVEDSENDALLLLRELGGGSYEPVHERVETPEAMKRALAGSEWDMIIADYRLPRFGALEALEMARAAGSDAPFVVVSGKIGEEAAVEIMQAGASDFLTKDNLALLVPTVERGLQETRDRRKHKRAQEELRRRDAVLEAVRFAAERFLGEAGGWEENVRMVLRRLGEAAEVSRVYIFENHRGEDGEVWATQRYEWVAPGISAQIENPLLKALPYRAAGFGRWVEVLGRGDLVYGHTRDLPESERPELQLEEILSIVVVPIFVEGKWWGFVGFDECVAERDWSAAEMDALKAAASTLGAVLRRRRGEEALRESEERYRAVVEQATDGIYLADGDTKRILETNSALQNMLGYTADELHGMRLHEIVAHDRENVNANVERTLREGKRYIRERNYRRKDGSVVVVEIAASTINYGGKQVICAAIRDITERKKSEEALKESEARYRALVEHTPAVTYTESVVGETSISAYVSPQIEGLLGYRQDQLNGSPPFWEVLMHPDDRERILAMDEHANRTGEPFGVEYRMVHRDGRVVWVRDEAVLVSREEDGTQRWQGVMIDITERKRADEELRRQDAILEAVRFSAERFLAESVWEQSIAEVLERLGTATEVSRVYIFENYIGEDGELWGTQRYEWVARGVSSEMDNSLMEAIPYRAAGYGRWAALLGRGDLIYGHTREFPEDERPEMWEQGILSVLVVPIFVEGEWWGQIGFDDCLAEREWSVAEMDAIQAAANTLGAGIQRRRIEQELRGSEERYRAVIEQATENIFLVDVETRRIVESNPAFRGTLGYPEEEIHNMTLYDIVAADQKSVDANIRLVVEQINPFVGERKYRRRDGSLVDVEVSASTILRGGRETLCVVARDVTERARAQELLEQRVAALSRISADLTLDLPTEDTLDALAQSAVNASTAVACGVVLIDEQTDALNLFGSYGLPEGYTAGLQQAYSAGVRSPSLQAFRTRQPVLLSEFRRALLSDPLYAPIHHFVDEVSWDIVYSLPLVSRDQALGAIFFCFVPDQEPGEDEKVFLRAVADQTAVAVENARLFAQTRGKAVLEERQRLARELHDSVSQALYGIALGAKAAREWLDDDPAEVAEPLDYVISLAEAGITEMRALIFELRPESLKSEGVVAALQKQAAALEARHGIEVGAELCGEPEATLEIKEALYRIVQEALHNTVKHARASNVEIKMECDSGEVTLEISDDGVGFEAKGEFPGHLGLRSMRERASRLGGTLQVKTAPGKGAHICTRIPI